MSLMVTSGEDQMEEKKRLPVAQAMQKRRRGRAQQQGRKATGLLALAGLP
jgi:hypothetical protein